jgi:UDP-N-acetylglucosamine 2-epimerase (non-hydrolysing)
MIKRLNVDIIAGARPNFMKIAPIIHEIDKRQNDIRDIKYRLIHTGQHYDINMSNKFFEELNIPNPDIHLNAGGGTQAEQTGAIMTGYEKVLLSHKSELCIVVGDVTSSMACAIVAKKMGLKVAHVEAGIRSGDWSMPEEINRIVTDSLTNYFFTTSRFANDNLLKCGVDIDSIYFVGNIMIDTLLENRSRFIKPEIWDKLNLKSSEYIILTLHRPANVDDVSNLESLLNEIINNSSNLPIIFPVHPRTGAKLKECGSFSQRLQMVEPLGYLEFNYLVERAKVVITDSGGITEETTVMKVPCMTLRNNTERPETVIIGTNELIGVDPKGIKNAMEKLFEGNWKKGGIPEKWDGHTARRIVDVMMKLELI